uniref:Cystatin domain-containing protein n=1 Tax=Strongyloides papillosus TaxID=174720 RepID=A0A0N5B2C2_STREA
MKYLVFSIILSTVFVLTVNGVDVPDGKNMKDYTGDKSLPIAIAKNAIKKYNKIKNATFEFVEVLKVKQVTIQNDKYYGISFLAKKCRKNTTQEKKKDDKEITKSIENACITKIIYAKYSSGTSGEKLEVGDFIKKHTEQKSDENQSETLKKNKKKTLKRRNNVSKVKKQ